LEKEQESVLTSKKKLLIADAERESVHTLLDAPEARDYLIEIAVNGVEALEKIQSFHPDALFLSLMLPHTHGIELLKKLKASPETQHLPVIILSYHGMIQNYHAAIDAGAHYFLNKPFNPDSFFRIAREACARTLKPDPFSTLESNAASGEHCYLPKTHAADSYIKFWGTRGSNPVSGADYVRFGGNTCCLEVRHGDDLVIIDAGTGIRPLGYSLEAKRAKTIHLFIGHTHWDHITGFPFFNPIYHPDCTITIWAPIGFDRPTRKIFTEMLAYAYFPVRLDDIQSQLVFRELRDGVPVQVGSLAIDTHYTYHPGATLCFKITANDQSFGYVTDNEMLMGYHGHPNAIGADDPLLAPHQSLIHFFRDCRLLIHEAQYTPFEYQRKVGWGHSSIANAAVLIKYCGAKSWVVTHHDPRHTDEVLQKKIQLHHDILAECNISCLLRMAYDGLVIPL
jgi:CheY-like chemotaxis protein